MWMNEAEVEHALIRFNQGETPNLGKGAILLARLVNWTNSNSDGWPYWKKPARAANRLMELLERPPRGIFDPPDEDATRAELKKALTPIKSFLTRQGVEHDEVFGRVTV